MHSTEDTANHTLHWLKEQMAKISGASTPQDSAPTEEQIRASRLQQEREQAIKGLKTQQAEIAAKLQELEGGEEDPLNIIRKAMAPLEGTGNQEVLLQQLRTALSGKKEEDPNKMLIKTLVTQQNKTAGEGGTNTIKPHFINKATDSRSMAEWLANLNRQEEGESDLAKYNFLGEEEVQVRPGKIRSGMLDKATTNIIQKQVWPQQNLGEDWADEDVEFRQLRFKHMVTGETRTIESCSDPAEILGRLRLLCRMAYLKLRGYDWTLIKKMYAAFLTSIETREYSWESNLDRFETILYRRTAVEPRSHHTEPRHQEKESRKRYCRGYNREGCPKNSPHAVWFGNGPSVVKRLVYHFCAACLIRDRQQREHPEGHQDCPHKD